MRTEYTKLNQEKGALLNRLIVFNIIKTEKETTRIEIAEKTGLRTSTISYIIHDLKKSNLIKETLIKERSKTKGNKPFIITLNYENNYLLGIDLKKDVLSMIGMNLSNQIFSHQSQKFTFRSENEVEDKLIEIIKKVKTKYPDKKLLCVGLGLPGLIDSDSNEIIISNELGIKHLSLGNKIQSRLKIPCFIENNANASAYGEYMLHNRDHNRYLFFVYFHLKRIGEIEKTGIGSGLVINGQVYHGESYAAGEIGDIVFSAARETFEKDVDLHVDLVQLIQKAEKEDSQKAKKIVSQFGSRIGETISDTINIINPGMVVLGGDYPLESGGFFDSIKKGIEKKLLPFIKDKLSIQKSKLGKECVAIGAATIAEKNLLSPQFFEKIINSGGLK